VNLAAKYIKERPILVVMSGAGMSVDSGLPDFRGEDGLYK
jgi:NAD-dependent SIR2 family protein deacetylase